MHSRVALRRAAKSASFWAISSNFSSSARVSNSATTWMPLVWPVTAVQTADPGEVVGINTVDELAVAERLLAARDG